MSVRTDSIGPFLRWAGSKRQLLSVLSAYWSEKHGTYLEPFVGSGCLFFHLRPTRAILGDINSELIETYQQVQCNLAAVKAAVEQLPKGREGYYQVRALSPISLDPHERAARFIYLNQYAFNGLYRTNKSGVFNVPYGGHKSDPHPPRQAIEDCSYALSNTTLISGDFALVLEKARPGDFVYMDPPYSVRAQRIFSEYHPLSFGPSDVQRLRGWMDTLTQRGVEFVVSYADCEEVDVIAHGYERKSVTVRRNIAGFVESRRTAREWLISNKAALIRAGVR